MTDIDFTIQTDSWASLQAVKNQSYIRNFTETLTQHRLDKLSRKPINIVPFGAQVQSDLTIDWHNR